VQDDHDRRGLPAAEIVDDIDALTPVVRDGPDGSVGGRYRRGRRGLSRGAQRGHARQDGQSQTHERETMQSPHADGWTGSQPARLNPAVRA